MRLLTARWISTCAKCGCDLMPGETIGYERGCGTYCADHIPTDPEHIRELRQAAADRKADRRQGWADARMEKAEALLKRQPWEKDWAYITQPGHIPQRARDIARHDRGLEEYRIAQAHQAKATALRAPVKVAGDTERKRQDLNEQAREYLIKKGLRAGSCVIANPYQGERKVVRVNRKTVTVSGSYGNIAVSFRDIELLPREQGSN